MLRDYSGVAFDSTLSNYTGVHSEPCDFSFQQLSFDVSEPLVWSSQFVNAAYNPFLSRQMPFDE